MLHLLNLLIAQYVQRYFVYEYVMGQRYMYYTMMVSRNYSPCV